MDHAVNAGSVAWAFALPQPSVTHTRAAVTVDHAVNAGSVSFAFAFAAAQPSRTPERHGTTASRGKRRFRIVGLPPSATEGHAFPPRSRCNLGAVRDHDQHFNPVTRFWTGRGRLDYQGDLYEGGGRAVGVGEIELVSGNPDRRLTITLSSIPDIRKSGISSGRGRG